MLELYQWQNTSWAAAGVRVDTMQSPGQGWLRQPKINSISDCAFGDPRFPLWWQGPGESSGQAENLEFETQGDNYLDFSETNPFGEVT